MPEIIRNISIISFLAFFLAGFSQNSETGVHWGNALKGTSPSDFSTAVSNLDPESIKWIRTEISWADIHTAPNIFQWYQISGYLQALTDSGFKIIGILKNTPSWYTTNPDTTNNPIENPYYAPKDTVEWVKFVDSVVTKFQSKIKYWEIWNEPDGGFFQTATPLQKHIRYKELLASAYNKIKSIDPIAKILVGGFTTKVMSEPFRKLFLDSLFAINFHQYFDIMNIHVYELAHELKDIKDTMQSKGIGNYPLWITETNPWREIDPYNSEAGTANFLCGWMKDTLINYFNPQVICWFNLRNFVPSVPAICDTCDPNLTAYGLLNSLYQPTLVLSAFENCYLTSSPDRPDYSTLAIGVNPNPFSNSTTIQMPHGMLLATHSTPESYEMIIYDLFGREVRKCEIKNIKTEIFRGDLTSGIYFLRITHRGNTRLGVKLIITECQN